MTSMTPLQQPTWSPSGQPGPDALDTVLAELDSVRTEVMHLQRALDSRVAIEQAKGYVAAIAGVTTTRAFEALRRFSRNHNLKLQQVCRDIVAGTLPGRAELLDLARQPA